jgi:penicillin amidase
MPTDCAMARWSTAARTIAPQRVGASGDRDCVLATSSLPDSGDQFVQAPAARYVWDLADRSASRWVVPHGTTGSAGTEHAVDQQPLWLQGDLAPVPDDDLSEGPCLDWRA